MPLIYNARTKRLGSTDNNNWYTDLKSNISSIVSGDNNSGIISSITNLFNDVSSTVNTIEKSFESSGLINSILSLSNNINEISQNINNIINSTDISYQDKTVLLKLQQAINEGTLVKTIPAGANINDYQAVTINNTVFYIKKNKTKQYIIYTVIGICLFSLIMILLKRKK